ncbi:SGNH/GDSL hydrolase family protein [Salinactinospora qingdaonensis]|uniref:SGNH/GDSL hydrolase family protein n=1 Tax=Salinactinospora qingdaonensis TaxID=702744 RepID=A0ABP7EVZ7_9ACTN
MGTRTLVVSIVAATLAVSCIVVLAVPVTREALHRAWCDVTAIGCEEVPGPPGEDHPGEESDWRVRLDPVEAATWGNYFALGDSYSSGHGAERYVPDTAVSGGCWRSNNAYPKTLVESYEFAGTLALVACSGQRGAAMLEALGSGESQLGQVNRHTSLVTIGIGGNDLGFTSVLKTCMVRVPLLEADACVGQEDEINERMAVFADTFDSLVTEVRDRAPDARVIVVGYPRLFDQEPNGMYYTLTASDQVWLNETIKRFNDQLAEAVEAFDTEIAEEGQVGSVEFVDAYQVLDGHEIGTEEPWVNGVLISELQDGITLDTSTFHPTAAGQQAVGRRLAAQVEAGPGRDLYATREIVDGASSEVLAGEVD